MAKVNLSRLQPARPTVMAVLGLLWAVSFGALRDFVWADIRAGLIELRGLSRATRALVWFGLLLVGMMVLALLFNDVLRAAFPLIAGIDGTPGRGALLPVALLPVSLFLLSIAWAFILTGALHAHPLARIGILIFYVIAMGVRVLSLLLTQSSPDSGSLSGWLCAAALLAVPVFFILRRRSKAHPIVDFTVLLVLASIIYIVSQTTGIESWRAYGIPVTLAEIESDMQLPALVILPLLLFFGVDVANFARRAAGWAVDIVTLRMAHWALWAILLAVFALRWRDLIQETVERLKASPLMSLLPAYLGALGVPLIVGVVWLWLRPGQAKGADEEPQGGLAPKSLDEAVERLALPLIVVYYIASFVTSFALGQTVMDVGGLLISFGALAVAFLFWRRGKRHYALYLGVFGALSIWRELIKPGAPLGMLGVSTSNAPFVDFWWVAALTVIGIIWLVRRQLTPERGAQLLLLILITALMRQTSFIESPFSPFLAFAGVGFIAFGIVWDVATKGFWTNRSTPGLPRISRLFLYLGYILLTVTMINWALASHNLETLGQFTGNVADVGFSRFGKPFLYAVIAATIAMPVGAGGGGRLDIRD